MGWNSLSGIIEAVIGRALAILASILSTKRQRQAIIKELIAECEDNLESIKDVHQKTVPMLSNMWNVHKGKLDFIPAGVREQLRAMYAEIRKINNYAMRWQNTGDKNIENALKGFKENLRPHLEKVMSELKGLLV